MPKIMHKGKNYSVGGTNDSDLTEHINNKNNPHEVTKSDIELGNVENKSSETIRSELTKSNVRDPAKFCVKRNKAHPNRQD